jgi:hypothetical protein
MQVSAHHQRHSNTRQTTVTLRNPALRGVNSLLRTARCCMSLARLVAEHPALREQLAVAQMQHQGSTWQLKLPLEQPDGSSLGGGTLVKLMADMHRWAQVERARGH